MYALEMKGIIKEYYGNRVLKGVDLCVKPGEIHALLGENGAGKSTLMNILFGMPVIHGTGGFQGEVKMGGEVVEIKSPMEAMARGIGMVHQEFMLVPGFTITENIKLNREIKKHNIVSRITKNENLMSLDMPQMKKDAKKAIDTLGLDIEEWALVSGLPVGHMQFVEIAREIDKLGIKMLVFDEPTAVLTESEADNLLKAMKHLASTGIGILFITHRLDEVMDAADSITILRDGELVATRMKTDTNVLELAELMVGRKVEMKRKSNETLTNMASPIVLEINDLRVKMPGEEVKGVNLQVKKGEILGIGGLAGQGKIGIANGIMGLYDSKGTVKLNQKVLDISNTTAVLDAGLAFVSEDRRGIGLLLETSIEDNIAISAMKVKQEFLNHYGPVKLRDSKTIRKHALDMIKDLDIRCTGPTQATRRLSGGNQQKVCVARALTLNPEVLFVSEPTRGIDIGAKKLVLDTLVELNEKHGMTIVMTSSELAELRTICDRIAIVCEGKVEGVLEPDASDVDFGLMMSGDYHKVKREGGIA
ncbi:sugar ABC transporter ATP-binding protein [Fusibacter sp. A2]|uniref:sugar ABC transporter ATP-binding protein n=1 Tax=unclassified Fusibacter TaxID=2624464 RepID=UPI0026A11CBC